MIDTLLYYIKFGGIEYALVFFSLFFLYGSGKFTYLLINAFGFKKRKSLDDLKAFIKASLFIIVVIIIGSIGIGILADTIDTLASTETIYKTGDSLMAFDKSIFGVYPPFWFHTGASFLKDIFQSLSPLLILSYSTLSFFIGLTLIATILINIRMFYSFLIGFSLCFLISVPFWYVFPALSPLEAYVDNINNAPIPTDIKNNLESLSLNQETEEFVNGIRSLRNPEDKERNFNAVTSLPSMHVAWSVLILFFGIRICKPLALLLVPYFIFNFIATVYALQHYAIDSIAGIMVGTLAILLAKYIVKKFYRKRGKSLTDFIKGDIRALIRIIKT